MTSTTTETYTYTSTDIEKVMRRFTADIVMIAQSTGAITEAKARDYAYDMEALAKKGFLDKVDLTLYSGLVEVRATQYTVNAAGDDLTTSLVEAEVDGERLSSNEIASFFILLTAAGNDTTRNAINRAYAIWRGTVTGDRAAAMQEVNAAFADLSAELAKWRKAR